MKLVAVLMVSSFSIASHAGVVDDASRTRNNCKMVAERMALEREMLGSRHATKAKVIKYVKHSITNSDALEEKYWRISADAVFDSIGDAENLDVDWRARV